MKSYSYWLGVIDSYETRSYALIKANLFDNISLIINDEDIPEGEQLMSVQNIITAWNIFTERE